MFFCGEAKVVVEEEEEEEEEEWWINAYEDLCQHIEAQPEQAHRISANREFDTFKTEPNNYRSAVIAETVKANINASKDEHIDTPAVEGAASINTEELLKLTKALLRSTWKR